MLERSLRAEHIRTEPDGTRIYDYMGHELTEQELTEHMARLHESDRTLSEWKESLEIPPADSVHSDEAIRRLSDRGNYRLTQEQFLTELEHVKRESDTANERLRQQQQSKEEA